MAIAVFAASEFNAAGPPGTETAGVSNFNVGAADAANIVPGPTNAITAGNNAYTKFHKFKCTTFSTLNQIDDLRVWKSAGVYTTGVTIDCSLRTSVYTQPTYTAPNATTFTDQTLAVVDPGGANLGIGGALAGTITAINQYSDYMKWQLHTTGSTPAGDMATLTWTFQWREM